MNLHPYIEKVYVVSLLIDKDRKRHINNHFKKLCISNYKFFDATPYNDKIISEYYIKGIVNKFPPCFRCGQNLCDCVNNILIPQQVANWVSFLRLWKMIKEECNDGYYLICEDDVFFHPHTLHFLDMFFKENRELEKPTLIRLGHSGMSTKNAPIANFQVSNRIVMSNCAYLINKKMASYLIDNFVKIEHTSDVWLHRIIAKNIEVNSMTIEPLIATELSFNPRYAKFYSRIHPKELDKSDIERKRKHFQRVNNVKQYIELLTIWENY